MLITLDHAKNVILPMLEESEKALSGAIARDQIMSAQTNFFFQMGLQSPDVAKAGAAMVSKVMGTFNANMMDVISGYERGLLNFPGAVKQWRQFTSGHYKKLFLAGTKMAGNPYYSKLGLTQKDLSFIKKAMKYEERFLKKFLLDIKDPRHLPASQIPRDAAGKRLPGYRVKNFDYVKERALMYPKCGKAQVFNGLVAGSSQHTVIYWVLGVPMLEHCNDCPRLARRKYTWQTLRTVPRAGDTECKWKCYCNLEIRPKKAGPKTNIPGRATAEALRTAGRHARVFDAQGREITGTLQAEIEGLTAEMNQARQMMRIETGRERMAWMKRRTMLNKRIIERLKPGGYRSIPTISVKDLLATVDRAVAEGGKLSRIATAVNIGDEIILVRGDFSARGVVRLVNNRLVFQKADGSQLILSNDIDVTFTLKARKMNFIENITTAEEIAIQGYTDVDFTSIRRYLKMTTAQRAKWAAKYPARRIIADHAEALEKMFGKYEDGARMETLYRGVVDVPDKIYKPMKKWKAGQTVEIDTTFSSWTTAEDVSIEFLSRGGVGKNPVQFILEGKRVTTQELLIEKFSSVPGEGEVLMNTIKFKVVKVKTVNVYTLQEGNFDILEVTLKEIR